MSKATTLLDMDKITEGLRARIRENAGENMDYVLAVFPRHATDGSQAGFYCSCLVDDGLVVLSELVAHMARTAFSRPVEGETGDGVVGEL